MMHPLSHRDVKGVDLSYAVSTVGSNSLGLFLVTAGASELSDVQVRFGNRLREIRERVGVSQEKLAELAKLHRTYVSSVERGRRNISLVNIERLADALGVSLAELMPNKRSKR
jgi:ribosome-binding protein aMBF1 (putative translation factor)